MNTIMVRRARTVIGLGLTLCVLCCAQSDDEKKVVNSFKGYVQHHLDSYKTNRRERIAEAQGGGWIKEYWEMDANSAEMDIQRTTSLLSPYTARLNFRLILYVTMVHQSREDASADTSFSQSPRVFLHRHNYSYQDDKWVPKIRQVRLDGSNEWLDCTGPVAIP